MSSKRELDVVAALIHKDNKFLLCQRREEDAFSLLWEFPGGTVESRESRPEALKREIKEELDLDIVVGSLIEVFEDEIPSLKINVYLYDILSFTGEAKLLECNELGFFKLEEAGKLNLAPVDKKIADYLIKTKC